VLWVNILTIIDKPNLKLYPDNMVLSYTTFLKITILFLIIASFLFANSLYAQERAEIVSDEYIIVLKGNQNVETVSSEIVSRQGVTIEHKYDKTVRGFSARIPKSKLQEVKNDPRVEFVSENRIVHTTSHQSVAVQTLPTGVNRIDADLSQNEASGVAVAVLDTGIDLTHPDLRSNIVANKNCIRPTRTGNDDNGHGSHVAGTIAAVNNSQGALGVTSQAKLVAVKVLSSSGSGTWSQIICGLDWVVANASRYNIKVVNMSLGGTGASDNNCGNLNSDALHRAICRVRDAGITIVVAAGNSNRDSASFVPAAYDDAVITVSALVDTDGQAGGLGGSTGYGADDTFASFSNFGSAVDLGAPGVNIYSTNRSGGYTTLSGTSMASPHVAGAAAMYLSTNPAATWTQVRDSLKALAEPLGSGHTDPSGKHPEAVLKVNSL
jgi:subtilisin